MERPENWCDMFTFLNLFKEYLIHKPLIYQILTLVTFFYFEFVENVCMCSGSSKHTYSELAVKKFVKGCFAVVLLLLNMAYIYFNASRLSLFFYLHFGHMQEKPSFSSRNQGNPE